MSWDGKGKKNVYLCEKCGHGYVTLDVDTGVTPFIYKCLRPNCKGSAYSLCYKVPQPILANHKAAVEWYKPEQTLTLSPSEIEHVGRGGLLPREV